MESSPIKNSFGNIHLSQEVSNKLNNIEDDFKIKNLSNDVIDDNRNDNNKYENDDSDISNSSENKRKKRIENANNNKNKKVGNNKNAEEFDSLLFLKKRKLSSNFGHLSSQEDEEKMDELDELRTPSKTKTIPMDGDTLETYKKSDFPIEDQGKMIDDHEDDNIDIFDIDNLNNNIIYDYNNFDHNCNFDCDIDYDNCFSENLKSEFYCGHNNTNNVILLDDDDKNNNIIITNEDENNKVEIAINHENNKFKETLDDYNKMENELVIGKKNNNGKLKSGNINYYSIPKKSFSSNLITEDSNNNNNNNNNNININNNEYNGMVEKPEYNDLKFPFECNKNTPPSSLPSPVSSFVHQGNAANIVSSTVESMRRSLNNAPNENNQGNTIQVFTVESGTNDHIDNHNDSEDDAILIEDEYLFQSQSQKTIQDNIYVPSINQRIVLQPDEYEIILVLDNREVSTKTDRTYIQDNLALRGINCDTRPLVLGDVTWIAKEKKPNGIEIILDHIVERKRIDDLISSIKDGRFREQKVKY